MPADVADNGGKMLQRFEQRARVNRISTEEATGAVSADRPDSNPPSQGFSVEPRARGVSAPRRPKAKAAPEPRPPSTNSRPPSGASEGSGCPRCGRALQGRALVMHLKTCGVPSRSRGDPFAKPDPAQSSQSTPTRGYRATGAGSGDGTGKAQQPPPSPPIPTANRRNVPAQERPPSPPIPTHSRRTGPAQHAQQRPTSPPLPTASRQNGPVPAARPGSPALPGAGAQAMGSASLAMHDEEAPPDEPVAPCPHCGRTFRISALERHIGICQKVFQEKRKVFNAVKQAVPDEAAKAKKAHEKQEKMEKVAQGRKGPQDRPIKPGAQSDPITDARQHGPNGAQVREEPPSIWSFKEKAEKRDRHGMPGGSFRRFSAVSEIVERVSPLLCELLGYEPESLIGRIKDIPLARMGRDNDSRNHGRISKAVVKLPSGLQGITTHQPRNAQRSLQGTFRAAATGAEGDAVILDADGMPLSCRLLATPLFVVLWKSTCKWLLENSVFERVRGKIAQCVPRGFGQFLRQPAAPHIIDCQEVACIMTDVANTTRFATSQPPRMMAELLHQVNKQTFVYVTANRVVQREAHPYVYIHEAVGDSLLLLCNAEFMARYPGRTASIAIYVAAEDCSVGWKQALRCRFCTWVLELQVIVCFCADCTAPTAFAKHEGSRGYCPSGS
ncbi:Zc2hc1b [Symbiodinium sp. KB8]|nr:Zc2hc1b [Symbiodinium sp. KB8]